MDNSSDIEHKKEKNINDTETATHDENTKTLKNNNNLDIHNTQNEVINMEVNYVYDYRQFDSKQNNDDKSDISNLDNHKNLESNITIESKENEINDVEYETNTHDSTQASQTDENNLNNDNSENATSHNKDNEQAQDIEVDMIMLDKNTIEQDIEYSDMSIEQKIENLIDKKDITNKKDSSNTIYENAIDDDFLDDILFHKNDKKKVKKYQYNFNYILYSKRLFISIALLASFIGLYTGYLLFGSTSLGVLWKLNHTKETLSKEVEEYKQENAQLQKKVLELKALEPK